jgi:hypothetical protein
MDRNVEKRAKVEAKKRAMRIVLDLKHQKQFPRPRVR